MSTSQQLVTFRLGEDLFAADIFSVERVLRYQVPRAVPNVPPWMAGVMEYHARILPVVDLRARFGLGALEPRPENRILVLSSGEQWVGAIVDAVLEVISVTPDELAPPPEIFRGLSAEFLRGIVRRGERLVIVLDVGNMLTANEQLTLARSSEADHAAAERSDDA